MRETNSERYIKEGVGPFNSARAAETVNFSQGRGAVDIPSGKRTVLGGHIFTTYSTSTSLLFHRRYFDRLYPLSQPVAAL